MRTRRPFPGRRRADLTVEVSLDPAFHTALPGNLGLADLVEHPKTLPKLKQLDLGVRSRCVSQSSVVQSKAEAAVLWLWSHPFPTRRKIHSQSCFFWHGTWRCQHFLSIVLR